MLNFIDNLLTIYHFLMFPIFGLGVVGFFILFRGYYFRNVSKRVTIIGASFLILTFITFIGGFSFLDSFLYSVQKDLKSFINENKNEILLKVNDSEFSESLVFLENLIQISKSYGHHSSPEKSIRIEMITSHGNRFVELRQDSQIENEFWVFVNNFKVSSKNEIGRIHSNYFTQFIEKTEFELWNEKLQETRTIEKAFGKQNIEVEYISKTDSLSTKEIQIINNRLNQVKLTYIPTGKIYFGLSNNDRVENYLEALLELQKDMNNKD